MPNNMCRTAREKCDGIQPSCFTCASSNRDCTYTANPKKRGIQPGYIRTLELALAWTFANVPASEDALLNLLVQPEGRALLSGKDQDGSYKLHRKWRKSAFCRDIDRVLSGADPVAFGEKPASPTSPDDDALDDADGASVIAATPVGPSSAGALPHRRPSVAGGSESSVHRRLEPAQSPAALSANQPLAPVNRPPVPLRPKLKVPSNLWRLFDVYFAYTHCWFPIAEKHDVLKISYSYPEDGLDMSANSPGSGEHAELWSILAVASVQENAANPSSAQQSEDGAKLLPGDIYNIARSLIPSEQGSHELGHVKALLLLALVNIGANMSRAAWFLIGYAARLAFVLGLHNAFQPQGRFHGNEDQSPRGKHVFLACFALDTIVSAHLGREPFMRRDHVDRVGLIAEDGLEEWHPWVGCPDFKPSSSNPAQPTVKNPSISSQTPNSAIYDGPSLERYPSAGSNDLDALFDELATLEGPERLDSQPQFMQNLGFAPDMNLSDVLSSDYGQFDPMFNAYLQHSVAATPIPGQPGGGQTQGMEGRDFDAG
ncbi:hypothetical protein SLS55_000981 [Diplodia seriata]|uniref:Zn(2)-C6 fungal-type domain-containing protein n=1 Tax=Diplodia seriata TaxID=420778 RepID=A0ABR3CWY0_9PEZI